MTPTRFRIEAVVEPESGVAVTNDPQGGVVAPGSGGAVVARIFRREGVQRLIAVSGVGGSGDNPRREAGRGATAMTRRSILAALAALIPAAWLPRKPPVTALAPGPVPASYLQMLPWREVPAGSYRYAVATKLPGNVPANFYDDDHGASRRGEVV